MSTIINSQIDYTSTMLSINHIEKTRIGYFSVKQTLSVDQGNRLSYELSKVIDHAKFIYYQGNFISILNADYSSKNQGGKSKWQEKLDEIVQNLHTEIGIAKIEIEKIDELKNPKAEIISRLAYRIIRSYLLKQDYKIKVNIKDNISDLSIFRYLDPCPENFSGQAAIALNWKTSGCYMGTVKQYWLKHGKDNNKLINLSVNNRFNPRIGGIIQEIVGFCTESEKQRLLNYPNVHPKTQEVIRNCDESDIIVTVFNRKWGQDTYSHYVLNGLEISINRDSAALVGIDYDSYLQHSKIELLDWKELLEQGKKIAESALSSWNIIVNQYLNSRDYRHLFSVSQWRQDTVNLLFGNKSEKNVIYPRSNLKKGLMEGGVYRRCTDFNLPSSQIRAIALNLTYTSGKNFINKLESELTRLDFSVSFLEKMPLNIQGQMSEMDAVEIENTIKKISSLEPHLVITILPKGDKKLDATDRGSYYYHTLNQLLSRGIASQMVDEDNLTNSYIYNELILSILAKLGNIAFILADPLKVADYFIGLDVARQTKQKTVGTRNACACVRIYGSRGEFIKYKLASSMLEGEEINSKTLREIIPSDELSGKRVLIFRDGRFRGQELNFLRERAAAVNAKMIFVEITKSGTCRLFNQRREDLQKPTQYLIFKHSDREATVVTTNPPLAVGLAQPIRVSILEDGEIPSLDDVLEATIKLCLLHHGSYKEVGVPVPIFASDKIGYKMLKGLSHVKPEGCQQWWH